MPQVRLTPHIRDTERGPRVCVHGLGYVGLPVAAVLAGSGLEVVGVDLDSDVVKSVNDGAARHFNEMGLPDLVESSVRSGNLSAAMAPVPADVHIIAVGTPVKADRSPDLTAVESVARSIATVLRRGDLVIVESTVPPNTCEGLVGYVIQEITGLDHQRDYLLAHCPERVLPGNVMHELIHNDRVVGGTSKQATAAAKNLYTRFVKGAIIETDARTAETSKLLENTYRDINIALANELAELASSVGVDVDRAFALANRHPRVHLHRPGIGVGGHCIPVDPWFLVAINPHRAQLLSAARAVNDGVPSRVAAAIITELRRCYRASVVLLGLSYKEDVDDFRGSPSVEVAHRLALEPWLRVIVVDPHCSKLPQHLEQLGTVELMEEDEATATDSLIVLLTRHKLFGPLVAKRPDVVDARELLYGTNEALPAALTGPQEVTGRDLKAGPDDSEAPRLY